jgi:hypothetical protein
MQGQGGGGSWGCPLIRQACGMRASSCLRDGLRFQVSEMDDRRSGLSGGFANGFFQEPACEMAGAAIVSETVHRSD